MVQECGAGLVRLRRAGVLAFEAPPLVRSGPADPTVTARVAAGLRLAPSDIRAVAWVDNGPGWVAALLRDAAAVLELEPDYSAMGDLNVGAVGRYPAGSECAVEVRAFVPSLGVPEDPVTGSLNAGLAQWLIEAGELPASYVASQGTRLGRLGRVQVDRVDGVTWIGGATNTTIVGAVDIDS